MFEIDNYYHKYELLGKGAYSNVFKGYHKVTKDPVAIKEIDIMKNSKNIDRFHKEIEIMEKTDNINIIKIITSIENKDYIFIIMEYCEKGDLRHFLKKRALKEHNVKNLMIQLVSGMQYMYNNNIYHRDLKPQNILIDKYYNLKITDFGLAKDDDENPLFETICGSPMYMAPEIMKYKKYDKKADLWSLGIIFYELLTGTTPFTANNHMELLENIETKKIYFPSHIKISHDARDLLIGLLNKNSKERITWNQLFNHPWLSTNISNSIMKSNIYSTNPSVCIENNNNDDDDEIFIMDEDNVDNKGSGSGSGSESESESSKKFYLDTLNLNNNYKLCNSQDSYYNTQPNEDEFFLSSIDDTEIKFEILSTSAIDYSEFSKTPESSTSYGKRSFMSNLYYYMNKSSNLLKTMLYSISETKNNEKEK